MKVGFVSLGCSKNLVVTEALIGLFKKHNYEITNDERLADIIVINTCGFILDAKQESIDTILEMEEYKKDKCKYLIVIGCLVERYKTDLMKELKDVDLFISIKEYSKIWELISNLIEKKMITDKLDFKNRNITTGNITAYLKIAEGCSNNCAYCAIPRIQGKYVSREFEDIIEEAKILEKNGYEEIIIIAQDTSKYGIDLYGKPRLVELLREISKLEGIKWIRFLYVYPESITDELIEEVKNNNKIVNYFDIPIQHISDKVLKNMNRNTTSEDIKSVINKIRSNIKGAIIRTTLITGFPKETEEDFNELYNFVKEYKIDKLGCFAYSKEENTIASRMEGQIPTRTKNTRKNKIMKLQQEISKNLLKDKIGNIYEVLIEDITEDGEYFIGRTYMDVPEEDGVVYIKYDKSIIINEFINCKIIGNTEYDLLGEIV